MSCGCRITIGLTGVVRFFFGKGVFFLGFAMTVYKLASMVCAPLGNEGAPVVSMKS
jgi:hypothetical protein